MRKAALDTIHALAREDGRIVFIGSDLGPGTLEGMKTDAPGRWFMEGVAEQHIVGMAAGLAMEGFIPYINTIATFLTRRCFEQVALDCCLHNLPVRLVASGGGVVYAPLGPTHLAIEDIAILRALPNMTVVAPVDAEEMKRVIRASVDHPGPMYVRFAKGGDPVVSSPDRPFALGRAIAMRDGGDAVFVTTGVMTTAALKAAEMLAAQGFACGVLHMHTIKPLDVEALAAAAARTPLLVTVEEHVITGGLGSAVIEALVDRGGPLPRIRRLGLPDAFPKRYGSQASQLDEAGLSPQRLAETVAALLAGR